MPTLSIYLTEEDYKIWLQFDKSKRSAFFHWAINAWAKRIKDKEE